MSVLWLIMLAGSAGWAFVQAWIGHPEVARQTVHALDSALELSVRMSLIMAGVMAFWLGLFRVAEKAGLVDRLAKLMEPVLRRLMPDLPEHHEAFGAISMNLAANFLGLDNAATPFGLKAMQLLEDLNPKPGTASRAQIMFLVLNSNALCWLPVSIMAYRIQAGSLRPGEVFLPILISSTMALLLAVSVTMLIQKIRPDRVLVGTGLGLLLPCMIFLFSALLGRSAQWTGMTADLGDLLILSVVFFILIYSFSKLSSVYEVFVEGAQSAIPLTVRVFPYLVAMLSAVGMIRACGLLNDLLHLIEQFVAILGWPLAWVPALPLMLLKPLSGSAARGWLVDMMHHLGPDAFASRLGAVIQGSTETTLYVMTVYMGSVGVRHGRYALALGLATEMAGMVVAVFVSYIFFS